MFYHLIFGIVQAIFVKDIGYRWRRAENVAYKVITGLWADILPLMVFRWPLIYFIWELLYSKRLYLIQARRQSYVLCGCFLVLRYISPSKLYPAWEHHRKVNQPPQIISMPKGSCWCQKVRYEYVTPSQTVNVMRLLPAVVPSINNWLVSGNLSLSLVQKNYKQRIRNMCINPQVCLADTLWFRSS